MLLKPSSGNAGPLGAAVTCVPCVVAGWPGQVPGEGEGEIENPPGQNNDVVEVQQSHNHLGAVAQTCHDNVLEQGGEDPHRRCLCARSQRQVPSNNGLIFLQQVIPPSLVYWPKATSRKKTGMPQVNRKIMYGMRNAPGRRKSDGCLCFIGRLLVAMAL